MLSIPIIHKVLGYYLIWKESEDADTQDIQSLLKFWCRQHNNEENTITGKEWNSNRDGIINKKKYGQVV